MSRMDECSPHGIVKPLLSLASRRTLDIYLGVISSVPRLPASVPRLPVPRLPRLRSDRVSCFADLLLEDRDEAFAALRRAESTGRPVGTVEFVTGLERVLGRRIARRAPGPAPAASVNAKQLNLLQ
jgi:hypothetical protein